MRTTYLLPLLLVGCALPVADPPATAPPAWVHAPAAASALGGAWWQHYGDPALDELIRRGWSQNPDIEALLARTGAARADRLEALGALFPRAGATIGWGHNREQTHMTMLEPETMEAWTGEAMVSWELDLTGKRRAILSAAKDREAAAWARLQGARLMLATEIAAARFEAALLSEEIAVLRQQVDSERESMRLTQSLAEAGLANSADLAERDADVQAFNRLADDLERRRALAQLRLDRLTGGQGKIPPHPAKSLRIPQAPHRLPAETFASRPDMIAAEAEVRAAFSIAQAAQLNLLPSLSLAAGADGGTHSPTQRFRTWMVTAGPRLEIPVWDPSRIAAVSRGRAEAAATAADYRSTALNAIEEIEGGYINFRSRVTQLRSAENEARTRRQAFDDARSRFENGLISSIEATEFRHSYYEARRTSLRLKLRTLNDHLALVRALGG